MHDNQFFSLTIQVKSVFGNIKTGYYSILLLKCNRLTANKSLIINANPMCITHTVHLNGHVYYKAVIHLKNLILRSNKYLILNGMK